MQVVPAIKSSAILIHHQIDTKQIDVVCHDVLQTSTGYTLGAGRVFGRDQQQELVRIITQAQKKRVSFIPNNVLVNGDDLVVWWIPQGENEIVFSVNDKYKRMTVHYPPLVFIARPHGLQVGALKKNARPKSDTTLYQAPVMCQSSDLSICTGNMDLPARPTIENMTDYEQFFFEGANTHLRVNTIKDIEENSDFIAYWESNGHKPFDKSKLVQGNYLSIDRLLSKVNDGVEDEDDEF